MGVYRYTLLYKNNPTFSLFGKTRLNIWGQYTKWPQPNGGYPRFFKDRDEAEMFLNKHRQKGRDVSGWRPYRVRLDKFPPEVRI